MGETLSVASTLPETEGAAVVRCPRCGHETDEATFHEDLRVCASCGRHAPLTANEMIHRGAT